jgi:integrase
MAEQRFAGYTSLLFDRWLPTRGWQMDAIRPVSSRSLCQASWQAWCINRKADGGLESPIKVVQARLGHASIQMTADTYGHLFPRADGGSELAAAERALMLVP